MQENNIFPFLWMRGESEEVIRTEMEKISESNIRAVCLEARPHPDFAGEGWWHDVDIVLDEAKKRGMKIWILDDSHFPTGRQTDFCRKNIRRGPGDICIHSSLRRPDLCPARRSMWNFSQKNSLPGWTSENPR